MANESVRIGDVYAGITGNCMVATAIDGDRCELVYRPNPGEEDPWWEEIAEVTHYFDLVRRGPAIIASHPSPEDP